MKLDRVICYRALKARDSRFDGRLFVGVTTTGIYCRPICGAQLPAADRCRYYMSAAEPESAGYRPCLRCRPERAPGQAIVDATNQLAARAGRLIAAGALNGRSIDALASELHVGPRQLRRAIKREYGVPPIMLAQTHRLLTASPSLAERLSEPRSRASEDIRRRLRTLFGGSSGGMAPVASLRSHTLMACVWGSAGAHEEAPTETSATILKQQR